MQIRELVDQQRKLATIIALIRRKQGITNDALDTKVGSILSINELQEVLSDG